MTRVVLDTGNNGITLELEYGSIVDAATGGSITPSTTQAKVNLLDIYVKTTNYSFYDNSNKLTVTGTAVNDATFTNVNLDDMGHNTQRKIASATGELRTLLFGSTHTATVTADLTDVGYSGRMTGTHSFTFPRRPYNAPLTPTVTIGNGTGGCSGNQNDSTKDRYWRTTDWRLETNGVFENWAIGSAGNRTSITYTPAPNKRYRFAVRGWNEDNAGAYGYSGYWYTTPTAPSGLVATRSAGSETVSLSWLNYAAYRGANRIYRSLNGGAATLIHTVSGTASVYQTQLGLGDEATYYVQVETPQGVNKLSSAMSNAAEVGHGYTAPNPPSSVSLTATSDTSGSMVVSGRQSDPAADKYWEFIEYELSVDNGAYGSTIRVPASQTTTAFSGWAGDDKHQVRVRSGNTAGVSDWTYSGPLFTKPVAPTGLHSNRPAGTNEVQLWTDSWGQWTSLIRVERSTNGGSSWTVLGDYSPGSTFSTTLSPAMSALYRFQGQTGAPTVLSAYSNELFVSAMLETDKTKLPGVNRIYVGTDRTRQVFAGATRVWTDGDS